MKTIKNDHKLPFGNYFIRQADLNELIEKFTKDKHNLSPSILNPTDRQNFDSVLRMSEEKVIDLLISSVVGSQATVMFLKIMRNIIDSYMNPAFNPLQRVYKIWHAVFVVRLWRNFTHSHKDYTLKENFISVYCYICIELNAHSLEKCLVGFEKLNLPQYFRPNLFESQPCKQMFRQVRSFTTTYSTVANCSVKEILERISKIDLQNNIVLNFGSNFVYPRMYKSKSKANETTEQ